MEIWSASVMSSVSSDSEPSIMITFERAKYLFNAGENTVRAQTHSASNRKKMKGLFLTQLTAERAGGLPGLLMSTADACVSKDLSIIGPKGLTHHLASSRSYTFRENLGIQPVEVPHQSAPPSKSTPIFQDQNVTVYALPLSIPQKPDVQAEAPLKRKREPSPETSRKRSLPEMAPSDESQANDDGTFASLISSPSFKPNSLSPEMAEEWRRILIQRMFPGTGVQSTDSKEPKQKQKQKPKQQQKSGRDVKTYESKPVKGSSRSPSPFKEAGNVDDYRSSRAPLPRGWHGVLPPPNATKIPVSYIIIGPQIRGKFNAALADALGVPNGPLRGRLTKGETVTFTVSSKGVVGDGKGTETVVTVSPEQCVGKGEPPSVAMVLDVPTKEHIPSLLQHFNQDKLFSTLRATKPEDKKQHVVKVLFHLLGGGVLEAPEYVNFMQTFGDDVQHIVASKEHCPNPVTFTSAAASQFRLNMLDKDIFPRQTFDMKPRRQLCDIPNLPRNTHIMVSNMDIGIRPTLAPVQNRHAIELDRFRPMLEQRQENGDILVELTKETREKFAEAQREVEKAAHDHKVSKPGDDVLVVPLGTGSAIPGKYRTVSSTLIQIPKWGNILLDAGEGTYYQLARHYGEEGAKDVLRNLKCLYVSHLHADHHLGVPMLLRKRLELDPPPDHPLYLVSLHSLHIGLRERQQLEDLGIQDISYGPRPCSGNGVIPIKSDFLDFKGSPMLHGPNKSIPNAKALCRSLGLSTIKTVEVDHGTRCFGLVLQHTEGWSIVFSADTKPTENLVQAGKDATLLIHEATMADNQAEMALAKKHSTFGQAIDIGKRMNAQNILLTHFSARHPRVPMTLSDLTSKSTSVSRRRADNEPPQRSPSPSQQPRSKSPSSAPVVALAFDQSSMRIGDMWKMQYYHAALEQIEKENAAIDGEDVEAVEVVV